MATATDMDDVTLLAHVRTVANLHDGSLAKWVLGVAAERIEKRAKETEDLKALRQIVTWWTNWPGGILVGQVNDNTWQAACQHPNLLGVAFHGPTPRFALEQARIALTRATDGPNAEVRHARADATAAPRVEGGNKFRPGPER